MMKTINIVFILGLLISSGHVFAVGIANSFLVDTVRADSSGKGIVGFDKPLVAVDGGLPPCSTHSKHLAFDTNTPQGRAIMSLVLAAQASNSPVYAKGTGECSIYSVVESWNYGIIK
jgi:hypothetical protein